MIGPKRCRCCDLPFFLPCPISLWLSFGDVEYLGYFECLHFHDLMLGEKKICVPWIQKSYVESGRRSTDPALQFKM